MIRAKSHTVCRIAAGALLCVLTGSGLAQQIPSMASETAPPPSMPQSSTPTSAGPQEPVFGGHDPITLRDAAGMPQSAVFRWSAPKGTAQVDGFMKWLGRDDLWGEDFAASERWDGIADSEWMLGPWEQWVHAQPGRRAILSIPMLPGSWNRSGPRAGPDANVKVSLEAGARGDYDKHFIALAKNLVKFRLGDSILRMGWEFNGGWYTWRASDNPKAWAEYFRHIVTAMRAVPGTGRLHFCWNPALGWQQFPADQAYPGDAFVDIIGLDVYDESWANDTYPIPKDATAAEIDQRHQKAWNDTLYGGNFGIKFWTDFARKHQKPFAICEWGVSQRSDHHGGGDDPDFIQKMHDILADPANNVLFDCYFDVQAGDGHHQVSPDKNGSMEFPQSSALFKELFGPANSKIN
jgi:hypothetical protein